MSLKLSYTQRELQFKFKARTSRGAMQTHKAFYLKLSSTSNPEVYGVGECAPLPGLSPDFSTDFETKIEELCRSFNALNLPDEASNFEEVYGHLKVSNLPSLRFGLETAITDFENGGNRILFKTDFTENETSIPINGLIWMGDKSFMEEQIHKKLKEGYNCLKIKIGGLDFEEELQILKLIRSLAGPDDLTLRLDANGAFTPENALQKLQKLADYQIHSIEQPIKPEQLAQMAALCAHSPIPIALDEELIGIDSFQQKQSLLETIKPQYLILKPTLVGGFSSCHEWIELAAKQSIPWWMTSALESNIGLNAISQFTAQFPVTIPQGLGTGQLYHNNIASPLTIRDGKLYYDKSKSWAEGFTG